MECVTPQPVTADASFRSMEWRVSYTSVPTAVSMACATQLPENAIAPPVGGALRALI